MKKAIVKNTIVHKSKSGRFSITFWKNDYEVYQDSQAERDAHFCMQEQIRVCIQFGRYNRLTKTWTNQQIWCNPDDLLHLREALDGGEEKSASSPHVRENAWGAQSEQTRPQS